MASNSLLSTSSPSGAAAPGAAWHDPIALRPPLDSKQALPIPAELPTTDGRDPSLTRSALTGNLVADLALPARRLAPSERAERLARLDELLAKRIEFMPHDDFAPAARGDRAALQRVTGPMPPPVKPGATKSVKPPKDLTGYLRDVYLAGELLDREQEAFLFRKFNYMRYQAEQLRLELVGKRQNGQRVTPRAVERLFELKSEAVETRKEIAKANLRLVVSIAKKWTSATKPLMELVSEGNLSLMRAADKFDISRGNKFSTYASWAILKNFYRSNSDDEKERGRTRQVEDGFLENTQADIRRGSAAADERSLAAMREYLNKLVGKLDDREQVIISLRFGLNDKSVLTLEELGKLFNITKERIRQIEGRAKKKLVRLAKENPEGIDLFEAYFARHYGKS